MKKLYVIVRKDLSFSQQIVQGGHAIAQYLLDNPDTKWDNGTLVMLRANSQLHLVKTIDRLEAHGLKVSQFREPDIGNQLTAIAAVSVAEEPFCKLQLI